MNNEIANAIESSERLKTVYDCWRKLCGDRQMPARCEFEPSMIVKALPGVVLIDVLKDPLDFRYRLIGTDVDHHSLSPHTGDLVSQIPSRAAPSKVWQNLVNICEDKQPSGRTIPYIGPHRDFLETRQITLPLSDDGHTVNMIMIAIDYLKQQLPSG